MNGPAGRWSRESEGRETNGNGAAYVVLINVHRLGLVATLIQSNWILKVMGRTRVL